MEWSSVLVTIASLIAGWFLNEISKKSQMSRERKALIGRALSNLLELHHQIRAVDSTFQLLANRFEMTEEAMVAVRQLIQHTIPQSDRYVAGYEDAIRQLSESDPVNAFRLSTSAQIPRFLDLMRTMPTNVGATVADIAFFERQLKEMLVPHLVQAIKELARLHGRSTIRQVNQLLDSVTEMPEGLKQLLLKMEEEKLIKSASDVGEGAT